MCNFSELVEIMDILRSDKGCPWDREQTLQSLREYLLEETFETIEKINKKDFSGLKEELGDLLFEIIFISKIASDLGMFTITDVIEMIKEKMIRRHPHVFGKEQVSDAEAVTHNWSRIKREVEDKTFDSILGGIPGTMPALLRAYKMTKKASNVNFDWDRIEQIIEKMGEEIDEFMIAYEEKDEDAIEHEVGDIIFAAANISRFAGVNPEVALIGANDRFYERFRYMEEKVREDERVMEEMSLIELEELWEESKKK